MRTLSNGTAIINMILAKCIHFCSGKTKVLLKYVLYMCCYISVAHLCEAHHLSRSVQWNVANEVSVAVMKYCYYSVLIYLFCNLVKLYENASYSDASVLSLMLYVIVWRWYTHVVLRNLNQTIKTVWLYKWGCSNSSHLPAPFVVLTYMRATEQMFLPISC